MLQKALNMAIEAHAGQFDKGGQPYINHPVYMALQMDTEFEKCVALLHDVLEDSDCTYKDISENISSDVADAVSIMTHKKFEAYEEYISRIKNSGNVTAIKVKLADLRHNGDMGRLVKITYKDMVRIAKYERAIKTLSE